MQKRKQAAEDAQALEIGEKSDEVIKRLPELLSLIPSLRVRT